MGQHKMNQINVMTLVYRNGFWDEHGTMNFI